MTMAIVTGPSKVFLWASTWRVRTRLRQGKTGLVQFRQCSTDSTDQYSQYSTVAVADNDKDRTRQDRQTGRQTDRHDRHQLRYDTTTQGLDWTGLN